MTMHAARIESSARLRRVMAVLEDGGWHSTREIMREADVCAVNSCIAELRENGLDVECRQEGRIFHYRWALTLKGDDG